MLITEKDIFYYVFSLVNLEEEKVRHIADNEADFPEVEVYKDIFNSLGKELSPCNQKKDC